MRVAVEDDRGTDHVSLFSKAGKGSSEGAAGGFFREENHLGDLLFTLGRFGHKGGLKGLAGVGSDIRSVTPELACGWIG